MNKKSALLEAITDRFFWTVSYKHRRIMIPILILLILAGAIILIQSYVSMQKRLEQLSSYEPIYVLAAAQDLKVGDTIQESNLSARIYYRKEFEKVKTSDKEGVQVTALIPANYDSYNQKLSGYGDIVGRVVKIPIFKGTMIRKDFLAEKGALPGLRALIPKDHSLLDIWVPQTGFNTFIKPGDFVDLYQVSKSGSRLLKDDVEVLLVNAEPLGQAPHKVAVNSGAKRNLTLAVPDDFFKKAVHASKQNSLMVSYNNEKTRVLPGGPIITSFGKQVASTYKPINNFQALVFIKGNQKKVLTR